ncbi:MAG: tRNA-wybutosine modification methyltransferase TYW3 [Nitrososphaeria archaeon]
MGFNELKRRFVSRLKEAELRGLVDEPLIPLLELINSLDDYFSTSSCAGRIVLISIPPSWKKNQSRIFFKSHYEVDAEKVWEALQEGAPRYGHSVYFKQEPFILHVSASSVESAVRLLSVAQSSGVKHSGILNISSDRVTIEMQSIERVEAPVSRDGRILITRDYLEQLVEDANEKLRRTRSKMEKLRQAIIRELWDSKQNNHATE